MQLLLERTEIHEAGKLADFGAALTTADAQALQGVLATLNVTERIEKTLLLLKKELELSKLQTEISKQVEDKMSTNQRRYMPRGPNPRTHGMARFPVPTQPRRALVSEVPCAGGPPGFQTADPEDVSQLLPCM